MKRDMNLIRLLLLHVEGEEPRPDLSGYTEEHQEDTSGNSSKWRAMLRHGRGFRGNSPLAPRTRRSASLQKSFRTQFPEVPRKSACNLVFIDQRHGFRRCPLETTQPPES